MVAGSPRRHQPCRRRSWQSLLPRRPKLPNVSESVAACFMHVCAFHAADQVPAEAPVEGPLPPRCDLQVGQLVCEAQQSLQLGLDMPRTVLLHIGPGEGTCSGHLGCGSLRPVDFRCGCEAFVVARRYSQMLQSRFTGAQTAGSDSDSSGKACASFCKKLDWPLFV